MQENASEKRAVTRAAPVSENTASVRAAAGGGLPTSLDIVTSPASEGIAQRTLFNVCMDLFSKLEATMVTNRQEFIDAYFATLVKQDEMTTLWTDAAYYQHLRTVIQRDVLPLYDRYCAIRSKVLEGSERRSWPTYCLWAVGICLAFEMFFTEGRVLRPQMLLPAVLVDGLFGYALFYLVNFRGASTLKRARKSLLNSIRELETQHDVAKRYEIFRSYTGGELLTAELQLLLASYSSPKEFWRDYYKVRKADPATPAELDRLNVKRFNGFLELHVNGAYSPEARQQRFNALFLLAHKAFLLTDRENYVLNILNPDHKS